MRLELPGWADLHAHLRQGNIMNGLITAHLSSGCRAILAMPNTDPPVIKLHDGDPEPGWSIDGYRDQIMMRGGDRFETVIVPLYLSKHTSWQMVDRGAASGLLKAVKYYPPHGTTNSGHSIPIGELIGGDVIRAIEDNGIVLCVHGEKHGLEGESWFGEDGNAEETFYFNEMEALITDHPGLRIVCEHITTQVAVNFVNAAPDNVVATITPQHMLYTVGDLLQGWLSHLRCMPIPKFKSDLIAVRNAAVYGGRKFFAGTDSAPHPVDSKASDCGCASGCFTGPVAPQLYAEAFRKVGASIFSKAGGIAFREFLCDRGPDFYGFPRPGGGFAITDTPQPVSGIFLGDSQFYKPLPAGMVPFTPHGRAVEIPYSVKVLS